MGHSMDWGAGAVVDRASRWRERMVKESVYIKNRNTYNMDSGFPLSPVWNSLQVNNIHQSDWSNIVINHNYCSIIAHFNKYFELKNSWGAGAPLNSNYLLLLLYCSHPYYMNP